MKNIEAAWTASKAREETKKLLKEYHMNQKKLNELIIAIGYVLDAIEPNSIKQLEAKEKAERLLTKLIKNETN